MFKSLFSILWRSIALFFLVIMLAVCVTGISPVYRFPIPHPFCGPDIFNPYRNLHRVQDGPIWKRANFHTHTETGGIFDECTHSPAETADSLRGFGYDIITFSNHNALTRHLEGVVPRMNVYEHGWNIFKFHKLVFGCSKVILWDNLLPLLASQRQFQLDLLSKGCDLLQINHPSRTFLTSRAIMEKLEGYSLIELDSGNTTAQEYWDWALSAGHYSFGTANDDLHFPDISSKIAVRCNFLNTLSNSSKDILDCLSDGDFYSMRIPDYGHGDWKEKHTRNRNRPSIKDIGLKGRDIFIRLSECADSIVVTGQGSSRLASSFRCDSLYYRFRDTDHYARFTAYFPDGEVIYSNPFARYDASVSNSPFRAPEHRICIGWTVLYNLMVLLLSSLIVFAGYKCLKKKHEKQN
ncbi:MAG: hypothetical protein ACI4TJ_01815 [Candidatus Cryptobacteroides sp.]